MPLCLVVLTCKIEYTLLASLSLGRTEAVIVLHDLEHFLARDEYVLMCAQSHLTLCDPMDYSPPGSSVHGTLQARILEWVAISFSRGSSQSMHWTHINCLLHCRWILYHWAPIEAPIVYSSYQFVQGCPRWLWDKESVHQHRGFRWHRFNPWVRKVPWGREWQPTAIFLPGKSHGLVGYSPWGRKKSDMTEGLSTNLYKPPWIQNLTVVSFHSDSGPSHMTCSDCWNDPGHDTGRNLKGTCCSWTPLSDEAA